MRQKTMSWTQYAARHDVTRKTVGEWRSLGLAVLAPDGHIDVAASDRLLAERPRKYRGGVARGPATEVSEVFAMPLLGPLPELTDFRPLQRPRRR